MAHTPEMLDYIAFMEWFQNRYPALYISLWKSIAISINGGRVTVEKEGLDDETFKLLTEAVLDYYQNKPKVI